MRGVTLNRFRGQHFYEAQGELRLRVLNWLSLVGFAAFADAADVSIADFTTPKLTGGGGLRLGLPPDYVAKARFDVGFSQDGWNFYLKFNEAF
jgi:hypothetical protein